MAQQQRLELRRCEPLHMDDVGAKGGQPREPERVLERLHRQPQARALEDPGRERVEELAPPVPGGLGNGHRSETAR